MCVRLCFIKYVCVYIIVVCVLCECVLDVRLHVCAGARLVYYRLSIGGLADRAILYYRFVVSALAFLLLDFFDTAVSDSCGKIHSHPTPT